MALSQNSAHSYDGSIPDELLAQANDTSNTLDMRLVNLGLLLPYLNNYYDEFFAAADSLKKDAQEIEDDDVDIVDVIILEEVAKEIDSCLKDLDRHIALCNKYDVTHERVQVYYILACIQYNFDGPEAISFYDAKMEETNQSQRGESDELGRLVFGNFIRKQQKELLTEVERITIDNLEEAIQMLEDPETDYPERVVLFTSLIPHVTKCREALENAYNSIITDIDLEANDMSFEEDEMLKTELSKYMALMEAIFTNQNDINFLKNLIPATMTEGVKEAVSIFNLERAQRVVDHLEYYHIGGEGVPELIQVFRKAILTARIDLS